MQCAYVVLYCHLWPVWPYSTFSHNVMHGKIFGKKVIENKMCVLIFSTTFVWNISHSKERSEILSQSFVDFSVKYTLFLSDFKETWVFSTFSKNNQALNSTKICAMRVESFHGNGRTDRQTDRWTVMRKPIIAFRNFENASKTGVTFNLHTNKNTLILPIAEN